MRTIKRLKPFKKDFKRISANPRHAHDVRELLKTVVALLVVDAPLPEKFRDHALVGTWKDYRECHLKPDLLLIYSVEALDELHLARLSSHSELFSR